MGASAGRGSLSGCEPSWQRAGNASGFVTEDRIRSIMAFEIELPYFGDCMYCLEPTTVLQVGNKAGNVALSPAHFTTSLCASLS